MSEQPAAEPVPEWDVADRMRKALRHSRIPVQEMADYLDVTRGTISTWINGRISPSKQTLRLWAMRTGVSFDWLCHGDNGPCFGGERKPVSPGQRRVITGRYSYGRPFHPAALFLPAAA